jgi:predicted amidohydrolase YtcJ
MTTLYRGGTVHAPAVPAASALVVDGRSIAWVGPEEEADRYEGGVDEVVVLDGALVTPGFVDAHVHLSQTGAGLRGVDLGTARSATEALTRIETHVRTSDGRPVFAPNWEEVGWPGRAPMTMLELDRAGGGALVYALRIDGHSAVISSALAARCRAAELPGWLGEGLVERDAHHAARAAFSAAVTPSQRRADIDLALAEAAAAGIVSVHENGGRHVSSAGDFADVLAAGRRSDTPHVVGYWAELAEDEQQARDLVLLHGPNGLAGDLNVDGSIGSRTSFLHEPYADAPGRGHAYLTATQVRDHVMACTLAGTQAGFHVIGDAAVSSVVEGFRSAAELVGAEALRGARHRLEHLEMAGVDEVRLLADLGVVASVQPAFDAFWGGPDGMYTDRLGPGRAQAMNPFGTMWSAGLGVALGSDAPVTPFAPWEAVRACAEHHDPDQRVPVSQAFEAHTEGGWRAARMPGRGRLRVGGPATFVVWTATRLATDGGEPPLPDLAAGIPTPSALRTVVDGVVIHDATA